MATPSPLLARQTKQWRRQQFITSLSRQHPRAAIFLVGGAVRDTLLKRPTKDSDLVITGIPKTQLHQYLKTQGRVDAVGRRFGVFKFKPKNWPAKADEIIDIALPRTEHTLKQTGGRRDFAVTSDHRLPITDDLARRDLTINAMALPINGKQNQLIDPHDGLKDLRKKVIRTVGEPTLRFKEDYSRILRAIRIACQLNFTIEANTWEAIKTQGHHLNDQRAKNWVVAREVIAQELISMMRADAKRALTLLDEGGLLAILLPELSPMHNCEQPQEFHAEGDVWKHTLMALEKLQSKQAIKEFPKQTISDEAIWATIFHDSGKPDTWTKTDRIRFHGHEVKSVEHWQKVAQRLQLSSAGVNVAAVSHIIGKHMLLAQSEVATIKPTTLEKYFFSDLFPGQDLLRVTWADISATVPLSGKPDFSDYLQLRKRLKTLGQSPKKSALPKPLVTGHDIMLTYKLPSGPRIGILLEKVREAQLNGKLRTKQQALLWLKKQL